MRLIGLCLLFVCINGFAKSLTLSDWIDYFGKQNIQIIYSSDFLKNTELTTLLDSDDSIQEFNQSLKPLSLMLISVDEFTYVINPVEKNLKQVTGLIIKMVDTEDLGINTFTINGKSTTNGLILINNIQSETLQLNLSSSGYNARKESVALIKDNYKTVVFTLTPKPVSIDKIIVTASQVNIQSNNASNTTLAREDIEKSVVLGNDPIRATQSIPGNTSTGLSGKTRTRGGNENESLIVLDNHILRNPFHFKNFYSLFSTINLSTVDGLDFYSGVFPLQYGGRLSSVLDIQTGDNINQNSHEVELNLLNASYTYRHSNADFSQQHLVSLRTGGKFINDTFIRNSIIQPEFDDAYFKGIQQLNDNWQTSQHLLISRDEITIDDTDADGSGELANSGHHDQDLWLQLNYDNHQNSYGSLQFYMTRKHNTGSGHLSNDDSTASLSEDMLTKNTGLKFNQTLNIRNNLSINFGFDVHQEDTQIQRSRNIEHFGELVNQLGLQRNSIQHYSFNNNGLGIDTFFNARHQFNEKLIFDIGMRFEKKQWIDENVNSPRFNLSYFYNDSTIFRFAIGRHQQSQYIDELLLEDDTPNYFDPTSADIAIFELNKTFSNTLGLRAEIYMKKYSSSQPYYENLFNGLHVLPDLFYDRIRISPDDAIASGAELTLKGNNPYFDWSASYIFSDVDDIINDQEVPRTWDQHNAFKFNLHMPINLKYFNNWHLDLTANYHNGWAKTEIIENIDGFEIGPRNTQTFDDFYQFDIKLSKQVTTTKGLVKFTIQANNLLESRNSCCVDYKLEGGILESETKSWLSIVPNLSVVYQWD